jgi:hypothetical protein
MKYILLATAMIAATPALAHNAWIKPTATTVAGEDGWVGFDAGASTDVFIADHAPLRLEMLKARAPDGGDAPLENAVQARYRSTFDVHLTKQGTWRIGMENLGVAGSYMLGGKTYRVGGRGGPRPGRPGGQQPDPNVVFLPGGPDFAPPAEATDVKLTLTGMRNETFVTLGKPSEVAPAGKGLEMQPITQPADLVADQPAKFRFLLDGKPVAGLEIEAIADGRRFRDDQGAITAKTGADGVATVAWRGPGLYWVHATYTDAVSPRPGIAGRRFQYAATLEVTPP